MDNIFVERVPNIVANKKNIDNNIYNKISSNDKNEIFIKDHHIQLNSKKKQNLNLESKYKDGNKENCVFSNRNLPKNQNTIYQPEALDKKKLINEILKKEPKNLKSEQKNNFNEYEDQMNQLYTGATHLKNKERNSDGKLIKKSISQINHEFIEQKLPSKFNTKNFQYVEKINKIFSQKSQKTGFGLLEKRKSIERNFDEKETGYNKQQNTGNAVEFYKKISEVEIKNDIEYFYEQSVYEERKRLENIEIEINKEEMREIEENKEIEEYSTYFLDKCDQSIYDFWNTRIENSDNSVLLKNEVKTKSQLLEQEIKSFESNMQEKTSKTTRMINEVSRQISFF